MIDRDTCLKTTFRVKEIGDILSMDGQAWLPILWPNSIDLIVCGYGEFKFMKVDISYTLCVYLTYTSKVIRTIYIKFIWSLLSFELVAI